MSDNDQYKISITGNDMSFERQISREIAVQIVVIAVTGSLEIPGTAGTTTNSQKHEPPTGVQVSEKLGEAGPGSLPKKSIGEYFDEVDPKRNPDRIVTIGNYLQNYQGKNFFNRGDLVDWFQRAAQQVPQNLSRDIKLTVKSGWITERPNEKRSYYVTKKGIIALEGKFSKEDIEKTSLSKRKS